VQFIIAKQNLQVIRKNHLYVPNKLYELSEQTCICVKQIKQTTRTKYLYEPNKLYELSEQICIRGNKLYESSEVHFSKHAAGTQARGGMENAGLFRGPDGVEFLL
jgi:hypothetical protein